MHSAAPHYPDEYTQGYTIFFGKKVAVSPDVLIPRLETESLVRRARDWLQKHQNATVIDIGTGSGIIGLSLCDMCDTLICTDISREALDLAQKNIHTHFPDKKVYFFESSLLKNWQKWHDSIPKNNPLLLVTNLPYIKNDDWEHMSKDTVYEPKIALFGGQKTGFELYQTLFHEIANLPLADFSCVSCMWEFGFDQYQIAHDVLSQYTDWGYELFADYAGVYRFFDATIVTQKSTAQ